MKVYLAGKITGDPNYREKFAAAAKKLESADTAVFLPDWEDSPGAQLEKHWCEYVGKKMVFLMEGAE